MCKGFQFLLEDSECLKIDSYLKIRADTQQPDKSCSPPANWTVLIPSPLQSCRTDRVSSPLYCNSEAETCSTFIFKFYFPFFLGGGCLLYHQLMFLSGVTLYNPLYGHEIWDLTYFFPTSTFLSDLSLNLSKLKPRYDHGWLGRLTSAHIIFCGTLVKKNLT